MAKSGSPQLPAVPPFTDRLDSLDVFRGLTIAAMILVSTPGTWESVYAPLDHALWNGWTPTDLIFPFLLVAMGAAVPVALARRRHAPRLVRRHVVRRALVLFALGLLLNLVEAKPPLSWPTFRLLGVLQRMALVYLAIAWLTEQTSRRTQAVVAVAALLGYWAAMTLVPVPGIGAGVLTPEGNLASYLDRSLLHEHLAFMTWESEGLLSTIPAISTALCGVFASSWLVRERSGRHHSAALWAAGAVAMVVGLWWNRVFPINKNLWSSSFSLFTGGLAVQLLALLHWVIDVRGWRGWSAPFSAFGRNPLALYFLSIALDSLLTRWSVTSNGVALKWQIYSRLFASWGEPCCGTQAASLFYALSYVALWGVVAWVLYRRKVFLNI